jgi:hypothetical protein
MPELQLPLFPAGAVHLTPDLAVVRQEDTVTYVHGSLPVFRHRADDVKSSRFITSQLYLNGHVQQPDLVRVFGVSKDSVKLAVKLFAEQAGRVLADAQTSWRLRADSHRPGPTASGTRRRSGVE